MPLDLVVCRDSQDETLDEAWGILSTARQESQAQPAAKRYHLRIHIEERHRHLKCFWDLAEFTSPSFALVANQIIFTALTYSLLQQQILRQARKALNKATKKRLLEELASAPTYITVFTHQYYGMFHNLEYTDMGPVGIGKGPAEAAGPDQEKETRNASGIPRWSRSIEAGPSCPLKPPQAYPVMAACALVPLTVPSPHRSLLTHGYAAFASARDIAHNGPTARCSLPSV